MMRCQVRTCAGTEGRIRRAGAWARALPPHTRLELAFAHWRSLLPALARFRWLRLRWLALAHVGWALARSACVGSLPLAVPLPTRGAGD